MTEENKPRAPKDDGMEVVILRGYNVEEGIENKLAAGEIVTLPTKTAKKLIKDGIATFPDDDE